MNAAIVPAISQIRLAFPDVDITLIKLVLSLPALTSIIFSILCGQLTSYVPKKYILIAALLLYAISGIGSSQANTINALLISRAFLGAASGLITPLVTDLIAYFFQGDERVRMIGFSNASSNLSGIFIPLLAGWLATFNWRYSFWVYGLAIPVLIIVWSFIPVTPLAEQTENKKSQFNNHKTVWLIILMNFLTVLFFYTLPTNLSIFIQEESIGNSSTAAFLLSTSTLISTIAGMIFSRLYTWLRRHLLFIGIFFCAAGFYAAGTLPQLSMLILSEILVGIGLGILFPYFSLLITQYTSGHETTSALAFLSSSFSLGIFLSPMFYFGIKQITGFNSIRSEFSIAAVLFTIIGLVVLLFGKRYNQPEKQS
jgi:predicted MFS family arabinose efflux permease